MIVGYHDSDCCRNLDIIAFFMQVGVKMLQQAEAFLATRGHEPSYHVTVSPLALYAPNT